MTQTFNVGSKSLFVTVTAWVFIVLAALASVSALLQNAAMASFLPGLTVVGNVQPLPLLTGLLMGYLPWVVGAGFVVSLATLACAIGLLLRLEWARRFFIALLVLTIAANVAGLWLQQEVLQSLVSSTLKTLAAAAAGGRRVRWLRHRRARDGGAGDAGCLSAAGVDHPAADVARGAPGIRLSRADARPAACRLLAA